MPELNSDHDTLSFPPADSLLRTISMARWTGPRQVFICACACVCKSYCAGLEVRAVCVCSLQRPNSSAHAQQQQPPIHAEPSFCQTPGFHYSKEDEHWQYAQTEAGLTSKSVAFQITHAFSQEVRTEGYFMQLIVFMLQRYSSRG